MGRKVLYVHNTIGEPICLGVADTYSELSTNYDDSFNPASWEATSIGLAFDGGVVTAYMLSPEKVWTAINQETEDETT